MIKILDLELQCYCIWYYAHHKHFPFLPVRVIQGIPLLQLALYCHLFKRFLQAHLFNINEGSTYTYYMFCISEITIGAGLQLIILLQHLTRQCWRCRLIRIPNVNYNINNRVYLQHKVHSRSSTRQRLSSRSFLISGSLSVSSKIDTQPIKPPCELTIFSKFYALIKLWLSLCLNLLFTPCILSAGKVKNISSALTTSIC